MKLIKLTDKDGKTYRGTQWSEGVTHSVEWSGHFCAPGCIHVYKDLHVALLLNPIHANFDPVRAWQAEGKILADDKGLKFGVASLTINNEITPLPIITVINQVTFGIFCALEVFHDYDFAAWAESWLSNKDRSAPNAYAATQAANAYATANAAAAPNAYAAYAAPNAYAAAAGAHAAYAAYAAYNAYAAANAVHAAYAAHAAHAAANAYAAAAVSHAAHAAEQSTLNLTQLAKKAMEVV